MLLRYRALWSALHNRPPGEAAQVENGQHHGEPDWPQSKQAGRCIVRKTMCEAAACASVPLVKFALYWK
ncbi:hypothetical protein REC12_07475 [Desulfosporosinus sp. PR]|nr:hypothetical protein [Desulfosporosinus sp. PR]